MTDGGEMVIEKEEAWGQNSEELEEAERIIKGEKRKAQFKKKVEIKNCTLNCIRNQGYQL